MEVVHHHIPIEIIRQILFNLEVKAVIQCECVCKEWRSTIQDPDFKLSYRGWKRVMVVPHGSRTSLAVTSITNTTTPLIETLFRKVIDTTTTTTLPPLDLWWSGVWCSCNGLVLFSVGKHILLWNPSTHRCTKVLELPLFNRTYLCEDLLSGLCYVSSTGDYKAVLLIRPHNTVMVASLKNKEWREVTFSYHPHLARDGVNFRNTFHWRVIPSRMVSSWRCKTIVYFDAESDEFKELPTPELEQRSNIIVGLGIIDNCLSMARLWKATNTIEVLVMKKYGVKRSWVNKFVISLSAPEFFNLDHLNITLYSLKCNTKVLIWSYCYFWRVVIYDLKSNTLNYLLRECSYGGPITLCSYVQSFVSPYEFIWRDDDDVEKYYVMLRFILERFNI